MVVHKVAYKILLKDQQYWIKKLIIGILKSALTHIAVKSHFALLTLIMSIPVGSSTVCESSILAESRP